MDKEITEQTKSITEILGDIVVFLFDILSRPVVQRQIIVFVLIVVLTWLLVEGFQRRRGKKHAVQDLLIQKSISRRQRWLAIAYFLLTPALALIFLYIASWLFSQQRQPNGLIEELTIVIWIWLVYRVLLLITYERFGETARQYQKWIITPIFLFLVFVEPLIS